MTLEIVPCCPFCKEELAPGLDALSKHLEQCDTKTGNGEVYTDRQKDADENPIPEALPE